MTVYEQIQNGAEDVAVEHPKYVDHYRKIKDQPNGIYLARRDIKDGYSVFRVGGKMMKSMTPIYNNFVAQTAKEAKKSYEYVYGWKATFVRRIFDPDELEAVLTDYKRMPL